MGPAEPAELVPSASVVDTVRAAVGVIGPTLAQGVIARRPRVVGLAERFDTDRFAVREMQRLARRYGPGPLRLQIPGRSVALVLSPDDVHRVLKGSPEPFALANREKQGALGQFQPDGVLVSHGAVRADRRAFNETVLDTPHPVHQQADSIVTADREEAAQVIDRVTGSGELDWDEMARGWRRAVRRVVLGDSARDDETVHSELDALRYQANWSYLHTRDRGRRDRLRARLQTYIERAEPGSLAGLVAGTPADPDVDPVDQMPQWLFAADPAGMAAYRALALLAVDRDETRQVREELDTANLDSPQELRRLRAAVLESVRLWPTTPMVLRETTTETQWASGRLPAGTAVTIYAPYFHRDDHTLAYAHQFRPENWLADEPGSAADGGHGDWPLIPFSEGPGVCPGQNLVLLMTSTYLATLLEHHDHSPTHPTHLDPRAVPAVISPFHLRFTTTPRERRQGSLAHGTS